MKKARLQGTKLTEKKTDPSINFLNFHQNGKKAIVVCSIPCIVSEYCLKCLNQFGINDPFLFCKKNLLAKHVL